MDGRNPAKTSALSDNPEGDFFSALPLEVFHLIVLQIKNLHTLKLVNRFFWKTIENTLLYHLTSATQILISFSKQFNQHSPIDFEQDENKKRLLAFEQDESVLMNWKKMPAEDNKEVAEHFLSILEFSVSHPRYARFCFRLIELNLTPQFLKVNSPNALTKKELLPMLNAFLNEKGFYITNPLSIEKGIDVNDQGSLDNAQDLPKFFFKLLNGNFIANSSTVNSSYLVACLNKLKELSGKSKLWRSIRLIDDIVSSSFGDTKFREKIYYNLSGFVFDTEGEFNFNKIHLDYPNFFSSKIIPIRIHESTINHGNFENGTYELSVTNSNMIACSFYGSEIRGLNFENSNLSGSSFFAASIIRSKIRLVKCNLSQVDFSMAGFSDHSLEDLSFDHCQWDEVKTNLAEIVKSESGYEFLFRKTEDKIHEKLICSQVKLLLVIFFNIQCDQYQNSNRNNFCLPDLIAAFACLENLFLNKIETVPVMMKVLKSFQEELKKLNDSEVFEKFLSDLISIGLNEYADSDIYLQPDLEVLNGNLDIFAKHFQLLHEKGALLESDQRDISWVRLRLAVSLKNALMLMGNFPMGNMNNLPMGNMNNLPMGNFPMGNMNNSLMGNMNNLPMGNMIPQPINFMQNPNRLFSPALAPTPFPIQAGRVNPNQVPSDPTQAQAMNALNNNDEENSADSAELSDDDLEPPRKKQKTGEDSFNPKP